MQPVERYGSCVHRLPPRRLFVELRHIHITIGGEGECARYSRCRHHEHGGAGATCLRQHQALMDAEAMLLIHNSKRESLKSHVFLKEGMGADKNIHFAIRCGAENILALLSFLPAREKRKTHTRHLAEWLQGCEMLTG